MKQPDSILLWGLLCSWVLVQDGRPKGERTAGVMKRLASIGECMIEVTAGARVGFGGDTLNTAIYLKRCMAGADAEISYITALGDDPFSADMVAAWQAEGLDTSRVVIRAGALPGLYMIRTDEAGERSFYYWREQAAARRLFDGPSDPDIEHFDLVYVSAISLAILNPLARERLGALLARVRAAGGAVAFDTNYRPRLWPGPEAARSAIESLAPAISIALPNLEDDQAVFGDRDAAAAARRWHDWGCGEVVIKNGGAPCHLSTGDRSATIAAPAVANVVDTTAAGDSFNGAYLAARTLGESPEQACLRGHALAGQVIRHRGAVMPR